MLRADMSVQDAKLQSQGHPRPVDTKAVCLPSENEMEGGESKVNHKDSFT